MEKKSRKLISLMMIVVIVVIGFRNPERIKGESGQKKGKKICEISLGGNHGAAITEDGDLYCWGENQYGQLGDGTRNFSSVPKKIMSDVRQVSLGEDFSAAITKDGDLYCWGSNFYGQLGNGGKDNSSVPIKIMSDIQKIELGSKFVAAITNEKDLYCWGDTYFLKLGENKAGDVPVKFMSNVKEVSVGEDHCGVITERGDLYCWGNNLEGQLGDGTSICRDVPVKIMSDVKKISFGMYHSAAIKENGDLYCWGENIRGQVGNGTQVRQKIPLKILSGIRDVSLGSAHSGAVADSGDMYCWGSNLLKQIGVEEKTQMTTRYNDWYLEPIKVLSGIKRLALGGNCSAVITIDGKLHFWGSQTENELKIGIDIHADSLSTEIIVGTEDDIKEGAVEEDVADGNSQEKVISRFDISDSICGQKGEILFVLGSIKLFDNVKVSSDILWQQISAVRWISSNQSILADKDISCSGVNAYDNKSATLTISFTPKQAGTVIITGTTSDGKTASCVVTVVDSNATSETEKFNPYSSELRDFMTSKGTLNTFKYLCNDDNFINSVFVATNDQGFGNRLNIVLSDCIYRGLDGWRDYFNASTSVAEAEKIIVALLKEYDDECKVLSGAKTAKKFADKVLKALKVYLEANGLTEMLITQKQTFIKIGDESDRAELSKLLMEGKYYDMIFTLFAKHGVDLSDDVMKKLAKFYNSSEFLSEFSDGLEIVGVGLKGMSITESAFGKLYEMEALLHADEMYMEMLTYLKENCVYSVVQEAAGNVYKVLNGQIADQIKFFYKEIGYQILDWAGDEFGDVLKDKLPALVKNNKVQSVLTGALGEEMLEKVSYNLMYVTMAKKGWEWGVNISNFFLHLDDVQELKDSMRTEAYIGNALARWTISNLNDYYNSIDTDREEINAKRFYYSLYMIWQTRKKGEECLQKMLEKEKTIAWFTEAGKKRAQSNKYYNVSKKISTSLEAMKESIFTEHNTKTLLGISVACPVDVDIMDASGKKILTVQDGTEKEGSSGNIYYYSCYNPIDKDYVKYIFYPSDSTYRVNIRGKSDGLVDCMISSIKDDGKITEKYVESIKVDESSEISIANPVSEKVSYEIKEKSGIIEKTGSFDEMSKEEVKVASICFDEMSYSLVVGEKKMVEAEIYPANATSKKVIWKSDNEGVVTVNSDGVFTGVSAGNATITVSAGEVSEQISVMVTSGEDAPKVTAFPTPTVTPIPTLSPTAMPTSTVMPESSLVPTASPIVQQPTAAPERTEPPKSETPDTSNSKEKALSKGKIFTKGKFKYKITKLDSGNFGNNHVTLTGLSKKGKKSGVLKIPYSISYKGKSFNVNKLGKNVFKGAKAKEISLSVSIKNIPKKAFVNCKKLKTLRLWPVKSVAKGAFKGCKKVITVKGVGKKGNLKKLKKSGYKKFK